MRVNRRIPGVFADSEERGFRLQPDLRSWLR